ncbi:MAG: hypothetical protein Q9227_004870 [Pyrenula ochraceoflavens]
MPSSYFSAFEGFEENPNASLLTNFRKLALKQGWQYKTRKYDMELVGAMSAGFADLFGVNLGGRLEGFQRMCRAVGTREEDIPISITKCEKILSASNVNIFDLEHAVRNKTVARTFGNQKALAKYTVKNKKVYPKAVAKHSIFLRCMLKPLFLILSLASRKKKKVEEPEKEKSPAVLEERVCQRSGGGGCPVKFD